MSAPPVGGALASNVDPVGTRPRAWLVAPLGTRSRARLVAPLGTRPLARGGARLGTRRPGTRPRARLVAPLACLLVAFACSVALRVEVGGPDAAQSSLAGLVFALCLFGLAAAAGTRVPVGRAALLMGVCGGALISAPAAASHLLAVRALHSTAGFTSWALVVIVVATAEEVFLRGSVFDAVAVLAGQRWAVGVAAAAFALLHVPLYGWHVLPLDLAVGVVLGALRSWSGSAAAPAVAHVIADLVGWFVR